MIKFCWVPVKMNKEVRGGLNSVCQRVTLIGNNSASDKNRAPETKFSQEKNSRREQKSFDVLLIHVLVYSISSSVIKVVTIAC